MGNISGISTVTTAAGSLANLVLVTPDSNKGYQPQNSDGDEGQREQIPPTLLFHYEGEQTVQLQSDITVHYTERNDAVSDNVALKPEVITTHGFIGELNDVIPPALEPIKEVANKLVFLDAYLPVLSVTALIAYNEAEFLYRNARKVANSAVARWSSINGTNGPTVINNDGLSVPISQLQNDQNAFIDKPSQTKQQLYFQLFYGYWRNKTLFTVQTPWAIFKNMAIMSLRAVQDSDSRVVTDFEISFQMVHFVESVRDSDNITGEQQGRASAMGSSLTDNGLSSSPTDSATFASKFHLL